MPRPVTISRMVPGSGAIGAPDPPPPPPHVGQMEFEATSPVWPLPPASTAPTSEAKKLPWALARKLAALILFAVSLIVKLIGPESSGLLVPGPHPVQSMALVKVPVPALWKEPAPS